MRLILLTRTRTKATAHSKETVGCGEQGHPAYKCSKKKGGGNNNNGGGGGNNSNSGSNDVHFCVAIFNFTVDAAPGSAPNTRRFMVDSGASVHNPSLFKPLSSQSQNKLRNASNDFMELQGEGQGVVACTTSKSQRLVLTLDNSLYCKQAPYNLISVGKLVDAGATVVMNKKDPHIDIPAVGRIALHRHGKLFELLPCDFPTPCRTPSASEVAASAIQTYVLWHHRMGHQGSSTVRKAADCTTGMVLVHDSAKGCVHCRNGKARKASLNGRKRYSAACGHR